MGKEITKISCIIEDDCSIDFERLSMVFKVGQYASNRQKQQSVMIGAAMLVLDATKQKCTDATGKRYPTLVELLEFAGIAQQDINKLLGLNELPSEGSIASLRGTVVDGGKNKE